MSSSSWSAASPQLHRRGPGGVSWQMRLCSCLMLLIWSARQLPMVDGFSLRRSSPSHSLSGSGQLRQSADSLCGSRQLRSSDPLSGSAQLRQSSDPLSVSGELRSSGRFPAFPAIDLFSHSFPVVQPQPVPPPAAAPAQQEQAESAFPDACPLNLRGRRPRTSITTPTRPPTAAGGDHVAARVVALPPSGVFLFPPSGVLLGVFVLSVRLLSATGGGLRFPRPCVVASRRYRGSARRNTKGRDCLFPTI